MQLAHKAWMAGVIETKGKIRFTNDTSRKTNQLVLQVRSQHAWLIDRMCELTGVKRYDAPIREIRVADRRPCTEHCSEAHSHVVSEFTGHHVWAISGAGAAIVLDNLIPLFVNTIGLQTIADNILAGLPQAGQGRFVVDQTIIRLKKLGWVIPSAAMTHFVGTPAKRGPGGRFEKQAAPA